jgi:hypothetical protein
MKDLIKILIAIVFILGAYCLGNYRDNEKHKLQIEELDKYIYSDKENIALLRDSINKFKQLIDIINTKPKIALPQKKGRDEIQKNSQLKR